MRKHYRWGMWILVVSGIAGACNPPSPNGAKSETTVESPQEADDSSLQERDPLERLRLPREFRLEQEKLLEQARLDLEADPEDPEALIWVGRRLGYLGRFQEAIEVYTAGIELHPDDARLYRHRGHRFISIRQLDAAVADLERAAALLYGTADAIEPDGLPNEFGIPTSTRHSNVWYHLGLAYYLRGDFEQAMAAYQRCVEVSDNADMLVATLNWLYLTMRRLDRDVEAAALLEPVTAEMKILENREYHRLLLMYKEELDPELLLEEVRGDDGLGSATSGYALGTWYLVGGDEERAEEIYEEIVAGDSVSAFGFIAAEAELRRAD